MMEYVYWYGATTGIVWLVVMVVRMRNGVPALLADDVIRMPLWPLVVIVAAISAFLPDGGR